MARRPAPSAFLDFDIVGDRAGVQAMLERLDDAMSPQGLSFFLMSRVGPWLKQRAANRFRSQGDDVSGKWAPLQESTIRIRESHGFSAGPINRRTGELEAYITQSQFSVTPTAVGTALKYPSDPPRNKGVREKMKTAQQGKGHPKTVARPVLGMNERDLSYVITMLAFHVKGGR